AARLSDAVARSARSAGANGQSDALTRSKLDVGNRRCTRAAATAGPGAVAAATAAAAARAGEFVPGVRVRGERVAARRAIERLSARAEVQHVLDPPRVREGGRGIGARRSDGGGRVTCKGGR